MVKIPVQLLHNRKKIDGLYACARRNIYTGPNDEMLCAKPKVYATVGEGTKLTKYVHSTSTVTINTPFCDIQLNHLQIGCNKKNAPRSDAG